MFRLLNSFPFLVTIIHGDKDDFAPIEVAHGIADTTLAPARFVEIRGGNHFLNDCEPAQVIAWLETAIGGGGGGLRQIHPLTPAEASALSLAS